ncbi:MAG: hypothetical protein E7Z65_06815 [Thermoplasmata archaeon]|nr:hypothetical protein [Thermoplasmata archaeon]
MEIRVYNDFISTPVNKGRVYEMKLDDGFAKVTNFIFEKYGFVINYYDMETSFFTNQDRVGEMDYILFNATLFGRFVGRFDEATVSKLPGTGLMHRPSDKRSYVNLPCKGYVGLGIGFDYKNFKFFDPGMEMAGSDFLRAIESKYRADGLSVFCLDDDVMMEMYALQAILDNPDSIDDDKVSAIVSDMLRRLYRVKEIRFTDVSSEAEPLLEDAVYSRIMSDLSKAPRIDEVCSELNTVKY